MAFLHGVETIESTKGPRPITVVKSAVIGLVGLAPQGAKNTNILVASDADAAQFGAQLPGFTIPQALEAIYSKKPTVVIVVNVYDSATNDIQVTDEVLAVVANRKTKTAAAPLSGMTLKNNAGDTTYVLNTDYTVDAFGNINILASAIAEGAALKASYKKLDPSTVNNTQIIGAVDGTTNARTGLKCFDLAFAQFGFRPKVLIAPGFASIAAITAELAVSANKLKACYIVDGAAALTPPNAITGRGPSGTYFNTSNKRAILAYPMMKVSDPNPGNAVNGIAPDILSPYSQHLAGVIAQVDIEEGYWVSPSNHEIAGITGVERQLTAAINDETTETNLLNGAGIVTIFNAFGTGIRVWGNRNASFPSSTAVDNFIPVRRTADVIEESIELAQMQFLDQPINFATIDAVRESVNSFLRSLVQRGAIVDGECYYNPADNPTNELAAGHVTFTYTFLPPPPMERMTFKAVIDINLLKALNAAASA